MFHKLQALGMNADLQERDRRVVFQHKIFIFKNINAVKSTSCKVSKKSRMA